MELLSHSSGLPKIHKRTDRHIDYPIGFDTKVLGQHQQLVSFWRDLGLTGVSFSIQPADFALGFVITQKSIQSLR
jgi:hypothetical protein